jgi:hypothetical protein
MLGHSIVFQHFMEPKGSIPNSQELSTCSYPEPDQSSVAKQRLVKNVAATTSTHTTAAKAQFSMRSVSYQARVYDLIFL